MVQKTTLIENDIETYLVEECEKHNILCYKFVSPQNSGVPDRIIIGNGKTIFIELKAPNKKPRKLQEIVHRKMTEHGAEVRVIDSKSLVDDVITEIIRVKGKFAQQSKLPENPKNRMRGQKL